MDSLRGLDDIVISLDDKTTDKTGEIATKLGARVVTRTNFGEIPTQQDIDNFTSKFNFKPEFTLKDKYCRWDLVRNEAMTYCKNDWVFFPDSDEFVEWDLPEVEKLLRDSDQIEYKFVSSHNNDGTPATWFNHSKLFRKSRNKWVGSVHEVITPTMRGVNIKTYTDKIVLHHYQANRPYRTSFLPRMEYHYIKNLDTRTLFYLAREYFYHKRYDDAINTFDKYLNVAWWQPEITEAHYYKALCYWDSNRGDQARVECFEAIHLNPDFKRALSLISEMHYEPWKSKWKYIANNATNKDVLFG